MYKHNSGGIQDLREQGAEHHHANVHDEAHNPSLSSVFGGNVPEADSGKDGGDKVEGE